MSTLFITRSGPVNDCYPTDRAITHATAAFRLWRTGLCSLSRSRCTDSWYIYGWRSQTCDTGNTQSVTGMLKETKLVSTRSVGRYFPLYGLIALAVCLSAWTCSWLRIEPFYRYSFFPLWAGFIFFMDALAVQRHGSSLLQRMGWRYMLLFAVSSLFWWIFEGLNVPVQNWHYILDKQITPLPYFLLASLNFSTVLPAVMEIAEFLSTFKLLHPRMPADNPGPRLPLVILLGSELLGLLCLILPWIFPRYCFVLIWLSVALI